MSLFSLAMSANDYKLLCNFPKCRVRLSGFAWVTACAHVFCDQHGSGEFSRRPAICPACSSALSGKQDVVRTEMSPSEQYKAMVLVGLGPETILDVSHRALALWTYQRLEEYKQKYNEVSELLIRKNRQYQKLLRLFEALRSFTMPTGEQHGLHQAFSAGLAEHHSLHGSPPFLAVGPEGDRPFTLEPENFKSFLQFSSPAREKGHSFIKKN
ncbi:E3 ubiquitin-protein ligase CCNB1IP1 isoform X3 [Hoplias malabaricus]|uniref:E3 ubiquitin-protein ligase CCNB1IP1 isoform X3 n=1 Tax=Hoplias malabaricus TaxID=27720 RepID=UPI003461DDAE